MEEEIWKEVTIVDGIDFSGMYMASTFGQVKRLERYYVRKNGVRVHQPEEILPQRDNGSGYMTVNLSGNGHNEKHYVHRIVAFTFILNQDPKNKTQVNHIDENKKNNHVTNLEWITPSDNNNHGTHNERVSNTKSKNPIVQLNTDGELVKIWKSAREAERFGFNHKNVKTCIERKMYTYKGYIWLNKKCYDSLSEEQVNNYCRYIKNIYKIVQLNIDGILIKIWDCVKDTEQNGFIPNCISACLTGRQETHKGFIWKRFNDYVGDKQPELES